MCVGGLGRGEMACVVSSSKPGASAKKLVLVTCLEIDLLVFREVTASDDQRVSTM